MFTSLRFIALRVRSFLPQWPLVVSFLVAFNRTLTLFDLIRGLLKTVQKAVTLSLPGIKMSTFLSTMNSFSTR